MTTPDERWALAGAIPLTPARERLPSGRRGVITARPHPTGWFISARCDPTLSAAALDDFAEFVRVRTYLLLTDGPAEATWEPDGTGAFLARCEASALIGSDWLAA